MTGPGPVRACTQPLPGAPACPAHPCSPMAPRAPRVPAPEPEPAPAGGGKQHRCSIVAVPAASMLHRCRQVRSPGQRPGAGNCDCPSRAWPGLDAHAKKIRDSLSSEPSGTCSWEAGGGDSVAAVHEGLVLGERAEAHGGAALIQVLRVLDGVRLQFVLVVDELGSVQLGPPVMKPDPVFQVGLVRNGSLAASTAPQMSSRNLCWCSGSACWASSQAACAPSSPTSVRPGQPSRSTSAASHCVLASSMLCHSASRSCEGGPDPDAAAFRRTR